MKIGAFDTVCCKPREFKIRPILDDGDGPIDEQPSSLIESIGSRTMEEAVQHATRAEIISQVGQPAFDDSGAEHLFLYFCGEDEKGNRKCYRATASLEIKVELEEIPTP